jgi:hypothetical protein
VLLEFGPPLGFDVFKGLRRDDGEADQKDISLRIRERTKTIIIFLTSGIPETQHVGLAVDLMKEKRRRKEQEKRKRESKNRERGEKEGKGEEHRQNKRR